MVLFIIFIIIYHQHDHTAFQPYHNATLPISMYSPQAKSRHIMHAISHAIPHYMAQMLESPHLSVSHPLFHLKLVPNPSIPLRRLHRQCILRLCFALLPR